jgi:hypothetical protein
MPPQKPASDEMLTDVDRANGHASIDDAVKAALKSRAHRRAEIIPVARIVVNGMLVPKVDESGKPVVVNGILQEVPFSFRIRRLQRAERLQCELLATHDESVDRFDSPNITRSVYDQNEGELRMLYRATVREDRERWWDDTELQQEWGVGTGWELIGQFLGDRQQIEAILAMHNLGDGITSEISRLKVASEPAAM